jgi:1-acyl-sn-glycerol-3-phosphate acyltransferase
MQVVARIVTTLLFDLKVRGRHHVPSGGGVLIVSNHQGNLDPVLLGVRLDRPLNYIAKSELFDGRWAVRLLRAVNAFPVRQGSGDVAAVKETIRRLQAGHLVNIYPEGQRTFDGEIGPLQPGVALIIRRAGVPVVPAAICGSYKAWPIHRRFFRAFPIRVEFGPPLDLNGLDADQVMATLDRTLRRMVDELRDREGAAARSNRRATTPARSHTTCTACFERTAPGRSDRCSWPPAPPASR